MRDASGAGDGRLSPVTISGLPAFQELQRRCDFLGYRLSKGLSSVDCSLVFWDIATVRKLPPWLARSSTRRVVVWTLESPLIAHRAYHDLGRIAGEADATCLFPGASRFLPKDSSFFPLHWPNHLREVMSDKPWSDRAFLTMVSSNKRSYRGAGGLPLGRPYLASRMLASRAVASSYRWRREWTVPDLYETRLQAIVHFSMRGGFSLYGTGWGDRVQGERRNRPAVDRSYRGRVPDKQTVLTDHRFALCFENTIFPGYITEKIFDCFFAGTIPVYLGAPDIAEFVPRKCFVDFRDFGSFAELGDYLSAMSQSEASERLEATRVFMRSPAFDRFTTSCFVETLLKAGGLSTADIGGTVRIDESGEDA